MVKRAIVAVVWVSVGATLIGFFLPWAMIDVREPSLMKELRASTPLKGTMGGLTKDLGRIAVTIRRGAQTITGDLPNLSDLPKQVSGVRIPQMANQEHAKVAVALLELLTRQRQPIGAKSYAVYLLPGLALLCGVLLTFCGTRLKMVVGIWVLCIAIAGGGFWKLLTTSTHTLFIAITIGPGLWLSLWGYVGLALAAGGLVVLHRARTIDTSSARSL